MSATNILDRFVEDGDEVSMRPVEYALAPSPEKIEMIEKIMDRVRKKVIENSERQREGLKSIGAYSELDEKNIVDGLNKIRENAIYRMQIPREAFDKVVKSKTGEFKNIFQTRNTRGNADFQGRAKTSNRNFGTPLKKFDTWDYDYDGRMVEKKAIDTRTKNLRDSEKYGYIVTDPNDGVDKKYGEYFINFAPDNVKDRTTFSQDDSLNNSSLYPILFNDPERTGIGLTSNVERFEKNNPVGSRFRDDFLGYLKEENTRLGYNLLDMNPRGNYMEAQYHGKLGLNDVESIMIPDKSELNEAMKRQAEKNKFDIFDWDGDLIYKWGSGK